MTPRCPSHRAGQALLVHAAAPPYRERSHFDGQNVQRPAMIRALEREAAATRQLEATGMIFTPPPIS